jgi:hypothetical protein
MSLLTQIWALAGYILPFLFVLSLVVFFHELDHFLIGRWCGVRSTPSRLASDRNFSALTTAMEPTGELRPSRLAAMSNSTATPMAPR